MSKKKLPPNTVTITVEGLSVTYTTKSKALTREDVYAIASAIEQLREAKAQGDE